MGGVFDYQNLSGLSSFFQMLPVTKRKTGEKCFIASFMQMPGSLLVRSLKLEASAWNGKYIWNDRVVFY